MPVPLTTAVMGYTAGVGCSLIYSNLQANNFITLNALPAVWGNANGSFADLRAICLQTGLVKDWQWPTSVNDCATLYGILVNAGLIRST